jgi:hypothetical protein
MHTDKVTTSSRNDGNTVLYEVPTSIHFVIINIASWQATGLTDKRVVSIKLTDEQQNELRLKAGKDNSGFFEVLMSFD